MIIRPEAPQDADAVYRLNTAAFDSEGEAKLVDILRAAADPVISLVAEDQGAIVGHILFSPLTAIDSHGGSLLALGPMAVSPEHQRKGIGTALVREGLEQCRHTGAAAVFVLGHPDYYPRFGFLPASRFALNCAYDAPDEAFMALELLPDALQNVRGRVEYHEAFDGLE